MSEVNEIVIRVNEFLNYIIETTGDKSRKNMKIECHWSGKTNFITNINGFRILINTSKFKVSDYISRPNPLGLASLWGVVGTEIVNNLNFFRQTPYKFTFEVEAAEDVSNPHVLETKKISYKVVGPCEASRVVESVHLSQQNFFLSNSITSKVPDIEYNISLNGIPLIENNKSFPQMAFQTLSKKGSHELHL